jgi:hypothetical protein
VGKGKKEIKKKARKERRMDGRERKEGRTRKEGKKEARKDGLITINLSQPV